MLNVKGMSDIFGSSFDKFNHIIEIAKKNADICNFQNLITPILEYSDVFLRSLGDATDIVSKEIYLFKDKSDNDVIMRPEFTASVVRAIITNGLYNSALPLKFFSHGPLFRYERPQKGRKRQFHQINYEIFHNKDDVLMIVEILLLVKKNLDDLGLQNIVLEINSLGNKKSRDAFTINFKNYLNNFKNELSRESMIRLERNPLRIMDSKDSNDKKILQNAPKIRDFFDEESSAKFDDLQKKLDFLDIKYTVSNNLVRGLDYYSDLIFEFTSRESGAQNTLVAGGCYNNLVSQMSDGKVSLNAVGCAGGVERMMDLLNFKPENNINNVAIVSFPKYAIYGMKILSEFRNNNIFCEIFISNSVKKQLGNIISKYRYIICIGEEEIEDRVFFIKNINTKKETKFELNNINECVNFILND